MKTLVAKLFGNIKKNVLAIDHCSFWFFGNDKSSAHDLSRFFEVK